MIKVRTDRRVCQGHGNCVAASPEVFDLDDEGLVVLKREEAGPEHAESVRRAVYDCPSEAISVKA